MGYEKEMGMAFGTFEHQKIIQNIHLNLFHKIPNDYEIFLHSSVLKNDLEAQAPDISIFKGKENTPRIAVEIEHKSGMTRVRDKLLNFLITYKIEEFFVYIYDKKEWRRYYGTDFKNDFQNTSYSDILNIDFNDMIGEPKKNNNLSGINSPQLA